MSMITDDYEQGIRDAISIIEEEMDTAESIEVIIDRLYALIDQNREDYFDEEDDADET